MSASASKTKQANKHKDLAEVSQGRANIYQLISSFFLTEPNREMVDNLLKPESRENLAVLFGKRATKPLNDMAADFKKEDTDELVQEFHDLFLVQTHEKYTTAYESVYLTGLMLQRPHLEVKRLFQAAGAEFNVNSWASIEDSLGAELGFMHFLCAQEAISWAGEKSQEAANFVRYENELLEKHLITWIDEVCDSIAAKAETDLYRGLAKITKSFVNSDYDYISELSENFEDPAG